MNLREEKLIWEQQKWERAAESFARWKKLLEMVKSPEAIEHVKKNLQRIKDEYPQHFKNEVW